MIYLHAALMQDRGRGADDMRMRRMRRAQQGNVTAVLALAGVINILMVMLAAATFISRGS
ncbi:MAG: hypothetical protein ACXVSL_11435 [Solirubrobacteraceae bacterium]